MYLISTFEQIFGNWRGIFPLLQFYDILMELFNSSRKNIEKSVKVSTSTHWSQNFNEIVFKFWSIKKNFEIFKLIRYFQNFKEHTKTSCIHTKLQGVSCDRFLGHTHVPRTSRFRYARTRVRTSNLRWSHFTPAPAPFVIFQKNFSKISKKLRCSKKVGHSKAGKNVSK